MIFAVVVAILLLISSALVADDGARRLNDALRYFGFAIGKLRAAAVSLTLVLIRGRIHESILRRKSLLRYNLGDNRYS